MLVDLFTNPNETILDPFSGVGTIPFEACAMSRRGIGSDINPVAYYVTRAKVNPPPWDTVKIQIKELETYIIKNRNNPESIPEEEIVDYYHPATLKEIISARDFFLSHREENLSFLMSCTLHILHGNRPYSLSRRSHNIMPWPPKGEAVYKPLIKHVREKGYRMLRSGLPINFVQGRAFESDALKLPLSDESIDAIITSPPFHNNRDFIRMNRIRLWFAGWDYSTQASMKSRFVENSKNINIYEDIFDEFHRVLLPHGLSILHLGVIGNFDMAREILPLAEKKGFESFTPIYEDTTDMESQGIMDRGATSKHQFLIIRKVA